MHERGSVGTSHLKEPGTQQQQELPYCHVWRPYVPTVTKDVEWGLFVPWPTDCPFCRKLKTTKQTFAKSTSPLVLWAELQGFFCVKMDTSFQVLASWSAHPHPMLKGSKKLSCSMPFMPSGKHRQAVGLQTFTCC